MEGDVPWVVGGRFVGLTLVEEDKIHVLGCYHFRLVLLLVYGGIRLWFVFIKNGDIAFGIFANGD
jgi:hypothetical protein